MIASLTIWSNLAGTQKTERVQVGEVREAPPNGRQFSPFAVIRGIGPKAAPVSRKRSCRSAAEGGKHPHVGE